MIRKKGKMKDLEFSEYANIFLSLIKRSKRIDSSTYCGRCPVCGDSKKDGTKTRFFLMKAAGKYPCTVKCHNCGYSTSAYHFLKEYFPDIVEKYSKPWTERDLSDIKKLSESGCSPAKDNEPEELSKDEYVSLIESEVEIAKPIISSFFENYTCSINENITALNYARSRNIPECYISEMRLLKPEYQNYNTFRYSYFRDYIMIPFIDDSDNQPYYFHSRKYCNLESKMPSYLACPYRPKETGVVFFLNELRISRESPIIIAEGTIDSLHLPNSIAVNGIHKITNDQIELFEYRYGNNIIYALDNEMIDKDAKKKTKELLELSKRVFLWNKMAKESPAVSNIKDFNSLCCKANKYEITLDIIERYTANNVSALL
jgi:hypothetical protein